MKKPSPVLFSPRAVVWPPLLYITESLGKEWKKPGLRVSIFTRAKRTNNNKFCSIVIKTLKIDPEGTCGPIGLKSVSFFWCCSWHQNGVKNLWISAF